jgi:hypothetical protein
MPRQPLPPSYEVTLDGVPGFHACVEYSVSVTAAKAKTSLFGSPATSVMLMTLDTRFILIFYFSVVTTPFIYLPRSRPASCLPPPPHVLGFMDSPEWRPFRSTIKAKSTGAQDIIATVSCYRELICTLHQLHPRCIYPSQGCSAWPSPSLFILHFRLHHTP